jgi:hypothetical protein
MSLEDKLVGWTKPSSDTEKDKQDRTERMIRQAIDAHAAFDDCSLSVYAKGSYANNTNVRTDSDVDIAVQCADAMYFDEEEPGVKPPGSSYQGVWTPAKLRTELVAAMKNKFTDDVDDSGSTAIQIKSNTARIDADVVPCFSYRYYMKSGFRDGTKIFKKQSGSIVNYPKQQSDKGTSKNNQTSYAYKKGARLLKRIENKMAEDGEFRELPSFFVECLAYNCPNYIFANATWTSRVKEMLYHIWSELQGDEPVTGRWLEVSECFYLFHSGQEWTRKDGREFAHAAWNYLDLVNA